MRIQVRRVWGAAAASLLLLGATACGDDDAATEDAATEDAATEQADATEASGNGCVDGSDVEPISLRVIAASESFPLIDGLIAYHGGFFEEQGLDVEYMGTTQSGPEAALTVRQGDADVAFTTFGSIFEVAKAGRSVVVIGKGASRPTTMVTLSGDAIAEMAERGVTPESPAEERVAALTDITIAVTALGGAAEQTVRSIFEGYGVEPAADQFQLIGDQMGMAGAVRNGSADALAASVPISLVPVNDGDAEVWLDPANLDLPAFENALFANHVTSPGFAEENPEAIERYYCALERAQAIISTDLDQATEMAQEVMPDLDESLVRASLEAVQPLFEKGPSITEEEYSGSVDFYNLTTDEPIDESDVPYEDVVLNVASDAGE